MRIGTIQVFLLRIKRRFVRHKDNRGESMIHKHERLVTGV